MSWLLFLDESGHDHKGVPYEIHGGFAIHASKLWAFLSAMRILEQSIFGTSLYEHGSEIKGKKLLAKDRFKWSEQGPIMDDVTRRKHALNFLSSSEQKRKPRRQEFTGFGQACLAMVDGIIQLLKSHDAKLFATIIPPVKKPADVPEDLL